MTARTPEYVQRGLMQGIGSITAEQYGETSSQFVPSIERIDTTASSLNDKVQTARRALAEVAMAIGDANELIVDAGLEFQQGQPATIPGIDEKVLKFLDSIDARSAPDRLSEEQAPQTLLDSLAWFDAVDDGTPKHLVTRRIHENTSGQPGYNSENRTVMHDVLRKAGDVYIYSHYSWSTRDWRALSKATNEASETYFRRRPDGSFSPVVVARFNQASKDYNDGVWPVSPLFGADTSLLPKPLSSVGYDLKEFKRAYTVQSRMATTLSLLGALPVERGWRTRGPYSYELQVKILSEQNLTLSDGRSFGVTAYGEHQQPRWSPSYIGIQDNKTYRGFGIDCDEWRIRRPDHYAQEEGISVALIDDVNAALREKLLAAQASE